MGENADNTKLDRWEFSKVREQVSTYTPSKLKETITNLAVDLAEDDEKLELEDAWIMAATLIAFPFSGNEEMTPDEVADEVNKMIMYINSSEN